MKGIRVVCCSFNYNIYDVKKLKDEDLIKVIEGFRSIIIHTNK
jgi:ADP-dependent phosphofructokinase/glucokinase